MAFAVTNAPAIPLIVSGNRLYSQRYSLLALPRLCWLTLADDEMSAALYIYEPQLGTFKRN